MDRLIQHAESAGVIYFAIALLVVKIWLKMCPISAKNRVQISLFSYPHKYQLEPGLIVKKVVTQIQDIMNSQARRSRFRQWFGE